MGRQKGIEGDWEGVEGRGDRVAEWIGMAGTASADKNEIATSYFG
jgi:hypothetical protein